MIRSMTGFGRSVVEKPGMTVSAEIKSVNHRFFEFSMRAPRACQFLEDAVKKEIQSRVSRGKVDVSLGLVTTVGDTEIAVNHEFAAGYVAALRELGKTYHLKNDLSVSTVAARDEVFTTRKTELDEEELKAAVLEAVNSAVDAFLAMREAEGEKLKEDVLTRCDFLLSCVEKVEERSPETVSEYSDKLKAKITELLGDRTVDEQRLLTEVALFADRVAVAEETVRLRSHIDQMHEMFESAEPIGRKLDFLVQEMNRETNTIGSKAQDTPIARTVVDMKAEIEKIREQIQNIE